MSKLKLPSGGPKSKVLLLTIIAMVLGIAIYNLQQIKTPPSPSQTPSSASVIKVLPNNLTDDERFILSPPSKEASRSVLQKHAQTVKKLAKEANTLELKNCQANPLVIKVKQGTEVEIKNMDNVKHILIFDEEHFYELPPVSSKTIKAKFKYGTGDYGYVCDTAGLVAFLHIVL